MCGGACVSWFSRTQKDVTHSTTEAEYAALADVIKGVLFLRQVSRFMLPEAGVSCIPVFENNQGAVQYSWRRTLLPPTLTPSTSTCDSTPSGNWLGEKRYRFFHE